MDDKSLMEKARKACQYSYAPYSHFNVGAALLTKDGEVIIGCNVENSSFGLSMCAERIVLFKAVSQGKRGEDFIKIAIAGKRHNGEWEFCSPCGACRQVMSEFIHKRQTFKVVYLDKLKGLKSVSIDELLPDRFTFSAK